MNKNKVKRCRPDRGEVGQSTIEFALTLIMLMSFVLFYLQLAMAMAFGNFAHYATFMSARAYLSAGPSKTDQLERAKQVINRTLKKSETMSGIDRFPSIAKGVGGEDPKGFTASEPGEFNALDPNSSWMQGVRYTFKSRLFMIPLGRSDGSASSSVNSVTLKAESWLGREPDYDECQLEMQKTHGIFDNGC